MLLILLLPTFNSKEYVLHFAHTTVIVTHELMTTDLEHQLGSRKLQKVLY